MWEKREEVGEANCGNVSLCCYIFVDTMQHANVTRDCTICMVEGLYKSFVSSPVAFFA